MRISDWSSDVCSSDLSQLALQLVQQGDDLRLDGDVEGGHRLVADDELRVEDQRAGDADALALAAGELVRIAVHVMRLEPDVLQNGDDAVRDLPVLRQAVNLERLAADLAHGTARIERGVRREERRVGKEGGGT